MANITSSLFFEIELHPALFVTLGVVAFLIIVSNSFILLVIAHSGNFDNASGRLMASLAVADLGVGLTTALPLVHYCISTHLSRIACDALGFLSSTFWVVSVYSLTLLSVDRYTAIAHPFSYSRVFTSSRSVALAALSWALAVALWVLPLAGVGSYKFSDEEVTCYFHVVKHSDQWIVYMGFVFVPTTVVILYCYHQIWKISQRHKTQVAVTLVSVVAPVDSSPQEEQRQQHQQQQDEKQAQQDEKQAQQQESHNETQNQTDLKDEQSHDNKQQQQQQDITDPVPPSPSQCPPSTASPATTTRNNMKAMRTLAVIVGAFYLAWCPFVIEHICKAVMGKRARVPEWLEIAIYIMAVTNSFWNPFIYLGTNRMYRRYALRTLINVCPCLFACRRCAEIKMSGTVRSADVQGMSSI